MNKEHPPLHLEVLTLHDLDQIMTLQDKVVAALDNPELYVSSSRLEFQHAIEEIGYLVGYKTPQGQLAALGVYVSWGDNPRNYGYDIDLQGSHLLKVGQVDTTIVDPDFRGYGLQKKLCLELERFARSQGKSYLLATVAPNNPFSLNNFLALGYENKKEKLKYGGLRRCILCKSLI